MEEEKGGGSRSSFEMYLIYIYIFLTKFDLDFVIHFKDLAESSVHPTCCAIDPPVGSTLIASLAAPTCNFYKWFNETSKPSCSTIKSTLFFIVIGTIAVQ